jgi:hypothetical protein
MKVRISSRGAFFAAAVSLCLAGVAAQQPAPPPASPAAPQGQKPPQPGNAAPAAPAANTPPAKPALPAAASSIAAKPEAYYDQLVSVYATVEKTLSPTAFVMDQDKTKSTGQEIIVVAPRLHEPVEINSYVTVIGDLIRPDAAEVTKRAKAGATGIAEILAQHPNRPVLVARTVINSKFVDLARFIPPPMTPEEEVLDKTMKAVGPANGALRKGVDGSNAELVKTNTAILTKAFADTEAFWRKRGRDDAVKLAQTARGASHAIETAASMGNWNEAKSQLETLGQQCASCHKVYRERGEDGSFFIRPGSAGRGTR